MKIFADKKNLPEGFPHCPLLYPFWGLPPLASYELGAHRFDRYLEGGQGIFELTDMREAQAAILPFDWRCIEEEDLLTRVAHTDPAEVSQAKKLAEGLAAKAASENTPVCVFFVHDDAARRVPLDNSSVFRPSLLRSHLLPNEFALPAWIRDNVEASFGGEIPLRSKNATPVVGFCGYNPHRLSVTGRVKRLMRSAVKSLLAHAGEDVATQGFEARAMAFDLLSRSTELECEFIIRTEWWNGAVNKRGVNTALAHKSHKKFVANMIGSDYILCARGSGNYSYRFYETLSCGRIPIFINTDCVLPFEEWVDWRQYCVWVEEHDLPQIEDIILDFHSQLTPRQFQELQRACRQMWEQWLSPQGFFNNFHRYFV